MKRTVNCVFAVLLLLSLSACAQPTTGPSASEDDVPTWQEQYDLGVRYLEEGNYEEAIIAFTAAIEIDPKRAEAYVGRGDAYVLSGETEENLTAAQADYEQAIELDETNVDAYLGLSDVYIRQGEYDNALEILCQGIEKTRDQALIDRKSEIEESQTVSSSATRSVDTATGTDVSYFENCTYEYQGKQVLVTYTDDRCSGSMTYTMKDETNRIYSMAVLGIAATDSTIAVGNSGLFVYSWSITEVDVSGNYVAGGLYDQNGAKISD